MTDPVAEQLASIPPEQAQVLRGYWARAAALVPEAAPGLSYGMPALKYRDAGLVSLMPTRKGFSVYPYGTDPVTAMMRKYPGHEHTKGSIHFTAAAPLPFDLFDDLIRLRRSQIDDKKS